MLSGIQMVQQEKRQNKVTNTRQNRARWQLLYTLVNNPSLLGSRKHFQLQSSDSLVNGALNRNTKEGSKKDPAKSVETAATAAAN